MLTLLRAAQLPIWTEERVAAVLQRLDAAQMSDVQRQNFGEELLRVELR